MVTFLQETLVNIQNRHTDLSDITFILPSKRAGSFLRNQLKKEAKNTQFTPEIISIEDFVENLSELSIVDNTELLFKSYHAYLNTASIQEKESFETYSTWAITLLNDFNEIDRYMVPAESFFEYLANIKTIERWGVKKEKSSLITNYLQFWENLHELYWNIKSLLKKELIGFQGMVYREAADKIDDYIKENPNKKHVFIGFNALNSAEQEIIKKLLKAGSSEIYWDTDNFFVKNHYHSSSLFIRRYLKEWEHFENKNTLSFPSNFVLDKEFKIVEVQKNIGQVKYIAELLATLSEATLNKTAIVLGDESLLSPLLHSLPENVSQINVTMGLPLKNLPAQTFFELLFNLQLHTGDTLYYKDIMSLLNHPLGQLLVSNASVITKKLNNENITHISTEELIKTSNEKEKEVLMLLFNSWMDDGSTAIEASLKLLNHLKERVKKNSIEELSIQKLVEIFQNIQGLSEKYPYLSSVKSVSNLFAELMATSSLDFEGDAFEGLQVMGVLETRVLDFENVIIASVNEGIFPSGKSNSSFITYDLKQQFKLPLFMEKDAIYTYHFYRLLQRAKNITILYNGFSDGLNSGEKSRFISQLEVDSLENHTYENLVFSSNINIEPKVPKQIEKTEEVLNQIKSLAEYGFSPSALTSYIRNPIDFYFQKVLRLKEAKIVEENVAFNTLGTIVHDTLEAFYKPLEGKKLTIPDLENMIPQIHEEVTKQFKETFKGGTFSKGKNLIVFEVAKRYIYNFINLELREVRSGNEIEILQIETKLLMNLEIPSLNFPIKLRGFVDRVDRYNGRLRIIDYKTGKVKNKDLEINEWEPIIEDYKYSKAFQVLAYAAMISETIDFNEAEAGVISMKNLNAGFLPFTNKTAPKSSKNKEITKEVLDNFKEQLKILILEICNLDIAFIEKEI